MLKPGQLRPWSPFTWNASDALEPLPYEYDSFAELCTVVRQFIGKRRPWHSKPKFADASHCPLACTKRGTTTCCVPVDVTTDSVVSMPPSVYVGT